jgi:hypothetical protein
MKHNSVQYRVYETTTEETLSVHLDLRHGDMAA